MTPLRLKELADYVEKTGDALFARVEADGRHHYTDLPRGERHEATLLVDLYKLVVKQLRLKLLAC
jgi:hypothetical protein